MSRNESEDNTPGDFEARGAVPFDRLHAFLESNGIEPLSWRWAQRVAASILGLPLPSLLWPEDVVFRPALERGSALTLVRLASLGLPVRVAALIVYHQVAAISTVGDLARVASSVSHRELPSPE